MTAAVAVAATLAGCIGRTGDLGRASPPLFPRLEAVVQANQTTVETDLQRRSHHFLSQTWPVWPATATSRYNALADRIAEDTALIRAFTETARAVKGKDAIRARAAAVFTDLPEAGRDDAAARADRNDALIAEVCLAALRRADEYRRQLESLVVEAPEPEAIEAERRLAGLAATLHADCSAFIVAAKSAATVPSAPRPDGQPMPLVVKR